MSEENLYTFENPEYRKTYWLGFCHFLAQADGRSLLGQCLAGRSGILLELTQAASVSRRVDADADN